MGCSGPCAAPVCSEGARPLEVLDAIVVGAGAAGIAAARVLAARRGARFLVVEARRRIGGRALTAGEALGGGLDHGCQWLHAADVNPLVPRLRAEGCTIPELNPAWGAEAAAHLLDAPGCRALARALDAARTRAVDLGRAGGPDRPALDCLPADSPHRPCFAAQVGWLTGGPAEAVSAVDYGRFHDTGEDWEVTGGLGRAIVAQAEGLPIRTGVAVRVVHWRERPLRLETDGGPLAAQALIVTVPPACLLAGVPQFRPALPDPWLDALGALPAGAAEKVWLPFARDPFGLPAGRCLMGRVDRAETAFFQFRPGDRALVQAFVAGPVAALLAPEGGAALRDFAVEELVQLFGSDVRTRLGTGEATAWTTDPWARGAYSWARVGEADARSLLARPVDDRLWFAGEATSREAAGAVHGADASGAAAAHALLAHLDGGAGA